MCTGLNLACWLNSLLDAIGRMFFYLLELIVNGLILVIDLMPIPFDSNDIVNVVNQLPPEIFWAFDIFDVGTGVSIVMSAYVIRFIIRRLPVVG